MHNIKSARATPAANPGTTLSTEGFLDAILPDGGLRCVAMTNGTGMAQTFHGTNAEAAAEIAAQDAKGLTVYFGCATYQSGSSRKAANVQAVKAFWADIDCGGGKPYADRRTGVWALRAMLKATCLPTPMIVGSGRGLHIYWSLSDGISPEEWRETAGLLKETLAAAGLEADPSRTADVASILRPPGTMHRKDPSTPLPVEVLRWAAPCEHGEFRGRLVSYLAQAGIDPDDALLPGGAPAVGLNDDLRGGMDALRGSWFEALAPADKNACLAEMLAVPGVDAIADQERGEWLRIVMACAQSGAPDAENLCRQWSKSSARYDAAAFATDWRSACRDAHSITVGTLIKAAQGAGWDGAPWRARASKPDSSASPASMATAPASSVVGAAIATPPGVPSALSAASPYMCPDEALEFMNARYAYCGRWGENGTYY